MPTGNIIAIVPVRVNPSAKHRLSSLFDNSSRYELALAMLQDVLQAISEATEINESIIVSNEELPRMETNIPQNEVFVTNKTNLNEELTIALKFAEHKGASAVVIILADLPLLTGVVLDTIIRQGIDQSTIIIARDWLGKGTNILFLHLPTKFRLHFGIDSFSTHMEAARNGGYRIKQFAALETSLDMDNERAIKRFLKLAKKYPRLQNTQTYDKLRFLLPSLARRKRK